MNNGATSTEPSSWREVKRLADRALVRLHDVGVAIQQPLPFPFLQDVQREARADRIAGVAVGRDHDELVRPSVDALA